MKNTSQSLWRSWFVLPALVMVGLLAIPFLGLLVSSSPSNIMAGIKHPLFGAALWLSAKTTFLSLTFVVGLGTPLAWWLSRTSGPQQRLLETLVDLPMVLPPAVVGIGLLSSLGRNGFLGPLLETLHLQIPFTTAAVVFAQVTVSSPFYIQSAAAAFRDVDQDLLLVARTLGQSPTGVFFRVVIPIALPGLVSGIALSWGRALGEFGATLLFAGNFTGRTQTMPLAIYMALESDVRVALALSLFLAGFGVLLLLTLRVLPKLSAHRRTMRPPPPASGRKL